MGFRQAQLAHTDLGSAIGASDPRRCIGPILLAAQSLISHSLLFFDAAWDRRGHQAFA